MFKCVVKVRRWLRVWCAVAVAVLALPCQAERAIWMWEEDAYAVLESPRQAHDALAFLQRHHIGTLYLYADAHEGRHWLRDQPQRYAAFIRSVHARGMKVHALLGSWGLHTERYILPEQREAALAMVREVLAYNQQAEPQARFDGINLDIEPHVLDDWSQRREAYLKMFLEVSEAWMALKREMDQSLRIGPAIAFWLDGIPVHHAGRTNFEMAEQLHAQRARFAILMIDIDHFKSINDTYGHLGGDRVLAYAGRLIGGSFRTEDIACRYGGEEFCVLLRGCDAGEAMGLAQGLVRVWADQPVDLADGQRVGVTVSVGVCGHQTDQPLLKTMHLADTALYDAKRRGRNQAVAYHAVQDT